ncbi:MAG TPA: tripartite tricarboxylate transporter TctB family protein [Burkholderiales bacterium]|nr:tripartite tricarboxylate transporter TctB family protein [Burkholderiales bacterium]
MSKDRVTGLVALATSLVLFALTLDLKQSPLVPIGPGFYPRIVLGVTAVLAAALLAFDLLSRKRPAERRAANYGLVLASFSVFGVYVGLLPFLGFRIATLLFVAALQATIEPPKGWRGWAIVVATALVTTTSAYYIFERQLSVLLPRGRWTDF